MHFPEIFTLNVCGLGNIEKRRQLFYYMQKSKGSVFLAQETHSTSSSEEMWENQWGGKIYFSHGESNARGVCILIKNDIAFSVKNIIRDQQGRFIILDMEIDGFRFTLANVYGPNEDDPDFFTSLITEIDSLDNENKIVGGDFNFVMDVKIDKKGGNPRTHFKSQQVIRAWCEDSELIDVWRHQNPELCQFTWKQIKPTKVFCRLDFFLVSHCIVTRIESSTRR